MRMDIKEGRALTIKSLVGIIRMDVIRIPKLLLQAVKDVSIEMLKGRKKPCILPRQVQCRKRLD